MKKFLHRLPVAQLSMYASSAAVLLLTFSSMVKPLGSNWN
jgi:hypothetical protein